MIIINKNKKKDNIPVNIDNKHQEVLKQLDSQKDEYQNLLKRFEQVQIQYSKLDQIPNNKITDDELEEKFNLKIEAEELERKINYYNEFSNHKNYFIHTGHLLFNYYNKVNNQNVSYEEDKNPLSKSILQFFNQNGNTSLKKSPKKKVVNKTLLMDKYMNFVDSRYLSDKDKIDDIEICKQCNQQKLFIHSEGVLVCPKCGHQEYCFIDCDKPSYKEPPKEIAYFAYKRINHFNEQLSQFQGKESTEIKPEIYEMIKNELKKERITDYSNLQSAKVREILKKLNLNKYYEHIPHMINHLNGIPPPNISKSQEEILRVMFKEIQIPFMKYCPPNRQNFTSYPYILHKFCELLEWDELLPCFPLLKSRDKLQEADNIWEKICGDLGWCFYPST